MKTQISKASHGLAEVDPKNWTGGMVKSKTNPVPCRRNVVSIVPSSKPRSGSMPLEGLQADPRFQVGTVLTAFL